MSEFATVDGEAVPTVEHAPGPLELQTVNDATLRDPAAESDDSVLSAPLRGGPAAGRTVRVPRIAGTFPMFIGVDGGNYLRDKSTHDRPVYNWWPAGAAAPAGDPGARTDTR